MSFVEHKDNVKSLSIRINPPEQTDIETVLSIRHIPNEETVSTDTSEEVPEVPDAPEAPEATKTTEVTKTTEATKTNEVQKVNVFLNYFRKVKTWFTNSKKS